MFDILINRLFPKFLLDDTNGYAMAKAIEAAMTSFATTLKNALDAMHDVDKMPEWMLDEMAWSYYVSWYDFDDSIEVKRRIMQDSIFVHRHRGTKAAYDKAVADVCPGAMIEEWFSYGGEAYHYRMVVPQSMAGDYYAWATRIIRMLQPVRCVMDDVSMMARDIVGIADRPDHSYTLYWICGSPEAVCGTEGEL